MSMETKDALHDLKKRLQAIKRASPKLEKPMTPAATNKKSGLHELGQSSKEHAHSQTQPRASDRHFQKAGTKNAPTPSTGASSFIAGTPPKAASLPEPKAKKDNQKEKGLMSLTASTKDQAVGKGGTENAMPSKRSTGRDGQQSKTKDDAPDVSINPEFQISLRYRTPKKLSKLAPEVLHKLANYITTQVFTTKADRERFTNNLYSYRSKWMDFERTGLQLTDLGEHDEHIPVVFEKGKAMYARLVSAILGVDPMFSIIPNKAVGEKQSREKEDLLRWATNQYANNQRGIKEEIDKDCWNFVFDGTSITKHYWVKDVRKFTDVEENPIRPFQRDQHGNLLTEEKEIEKEEVVYDGPILKSIPLEDVYIIGSNCEDIDDADLIVHRQYLSKSDIIKLSHQGFFLEDAVKKVIDHMPANPGKDSADEEAALKQQKDELSGVQRQRFAEGRPFYAVYETYLRYDIDDDGIDEEIVVWLEPESRKILRITYLDRVSPNGKRPFVLKKLIHREGKPYGIGFAEMLFGLQNTVDYITNQRLDAGLFQIFPWFVYRAGSDIQVGPQVIGPGKGLPVDDVNDIKFPTVNGKPAYGFQEEANTMSHMGKVTGITDLSEAQNSTQGFGRTATGSAALVNELNANLDIYIKHYQWGFARNLKFLDKQLQELLPLGLEYRVVGADGRAAYKRFADRDSLRFECDFEITGNTINSNKAIERDTSQMLLQVLQNPIALQAGLVNPKNLYNAYKNLLIKFEIRDTDSYITCPDQVESSPYTALDEINMIMAGVEPRIYMNDKHAEKLAIFDQFEKSDEFGLYTDSHLPLYMKTKRGHEQYSSAIAAQAPMAGQMGPGMGVAPQLGAQIAAGSGNPSGQVPQQMGDMMPLHSMANPGGGQNY